LRLWGEIAVALTHTTNVLPNKHVTTTPFEVLKGHRADVTNLRALGCVTYVGKPAQTRHKLENRGTKMYLVGYGEPFGTKGWRLWDPKTDKIVTSRDVIFDESAGVPAEEREKYDLNLRDLITEDDDPETPIKEYVVEKDHRRTH
jgi:hypothetical protein